MIDAMNMIKNGNKKQKSAYKVMKNLNILQQFSAAKPLLCGTIPLAIDHEKSDLDIVLEAENLDELASNLKEAYGHFEKFTQKRIIVRNQDVRLTHFFFAGFEFELFAQNRPTKEQNGYLYMVIEYHILQNKPEWKKIIRQMKKDGLKTEPAFSVLLKLNGDPYEALIKYGKEKQYI
ncbi:DUF4269 domain-containing protein [Amphibacillus sp. Q70]|uniref:DUF4269 domain-containing protein n=1 Tax=Amphibacillus sp. Q70 TaxID=3453416 RepID=UPI003F8762E8